MSVITKTVSVEHTQTESDLSLLPPLFYCLFYFSSPWTTIPPASSFLCFYLYFFSNLHTPPLFLPSFWIHNVSSHVYSSLSLPLPLSNPVILSSSSMVQVFHLWTFAPGQLPPAEIPKDSVPTYPKGWRCTAGWQSEPLYWGLQRSGMPRLGTSESCRGAGTGTHAVLRCWCHSTMAHLHPTQWWAAHKVPGSGGWNAAAWQWCWLYCLKYRITHYWVKKNLKACYLIMNSDSNLCWLNQEQSLNKTYTGHLSICFEVSSLTVFLLRHSVPRLIHFRVVHLLFSCAAK